jgi:hypothetical protein
MILYSEDQSPTPSKRLTLMSLKWEESKCQNSFLYNSDKPEIEPGSSNVKTRNNDMTLNSNYNNKLESELVYGAKAREATAKGTYKT